MFYEFVSGSSFNLAKYAKSFLASHVSDIMKASSNDYRVLIYHVPEGHHVFVWDSAIQHSIMAKSLDSNKNLDKYPSNIKFTYLYNESLMFMAGDEIGSTWCFPFVIWQGSAVSNLSGQALNVLNKAKDVKTIFQFSDMQWESFLKKQEFKL